MNGSKDLLGLLTQAQRDSVEQQRESTRTLTTMGAAVDALKERIDRIEAKVDGLEGKVVAAIEQRYKWLIASLVGAIMFLIVALVALVGVKLQTPGVSAAIDTVPTPAVRVVEPDKRLYGVPDL